MTFDPRARARELANAAFITADMYGRFGQHLNAMQVIESALLAFAKEVLTQDPDHMMLNLGYLERYKGPEQVWKAMSAHRAARLEDGAQIEEGM